MLKLHSLAAFEHMQCHLATYEPALSKTIFAWKVVLVVYKLGIGSSCESMLEEMLRSLKVLEAVVASLSKCIHSH